MRRNTQLLLVFAVSAGYATCRYNIFGPELWTNWPSFILNKALCFALAQALLHWAIASYRAMPDKAIFWARTCTHLAWIHVLLSLALLNPAYFGEKFFTAPKMNLYGEAMLLFGVLGVYAFYRINKAASESDRRPWIPLAIVLLLLHTGFIGFPGWITPWKWPGGMPPISLWGFTLAAISLMLFLLSRKPQSE